MDGVAMTWRSRIARGALTALAGAWMLASSSSTLPARGQSYWSFQLEWEQTGAPPSYFRLCVNGGVCTVLSDAHNAQGTVWRAALPLMPPGEYRLVLEACGSGGCVPGEPDLVIRVVAPSPRRPPIEVIEGPPFRMSR
jgi:hypothetical protein